MTHRELPASGRGCFAAVVIAPIAAFAGLMAITTLLTGQDDQATGPSFGLTHPTRVSQTAPLETEESGDSGDPPAGTIAAEPLALRHPDKPTTTVTVPSKVVVASSASSAKAVEPIMPTPCLPRTTPAPTTTTTTPSPTTTSKPAVTTTTATVASPPTTTGAKTTTTTGARTTTTASTTSTSNASVPK